jgi:hypothetical protein
MRDKHGGTVSQTVQQLVDAARGRIREIRPGDLASLLRGASGCSVSA